MTHYNLDDTIAAISTPLGEGGISVIRVSGPSTWKIVEGIFRAANKKKISGAQSHTLLLGLIESTRGEAIDQVVVSLFKGPHSYTGEDVIEISSHGGLVVTRRILDLLMTKGCRHAEPGEFTKRAFLNGKMDLAQAEAVLDLIQSKSTKSAEVALSHLSGTLSGKLKEIKDLLMKTYAHLEAYVDFPEDDLEVYGNEEFKQQFVLIESQIKQLIDSFARGSLLREGISIIIVGKPNVGKSSLFNALLERDRALVSEHEGTTRDVLEENIEIKGLYARLIDTAGLSLQAKDELDQMGMEKTRQRLKNADLFLFVADSSKPLEPADTDAFAAIPKEKPFIVIAHKSDLPKGLEIGELQKLGQPACILPVSSVERTGFAELEETILHQVSTGSVEAEGEQITRLRHKQALQNSFECLMRAHQAFDKKLALECVTVDLKAALDSLRELIGEIYSEDLLDVIFSEFCIGK